MHKVYFTEQSTAYTPYNLLITFTPENPYFCRSVRTFRPSQTTLHESKKHSLPVVLCPAAYQHFPAGGRVVCLPQPDAKGTGHARRMLQGSVYAGDRRTGKPPALSRRHRDPHGLCARQPASGRRRPPVVLRRADLGRVTGRLRTA